jgi:hypothetical protein
VDLSIITGDWPYDEEEDANNVRKVRGVDGKMKVQLRIRGGVVQWEIEGRPDGQTPHTSPSVLDYCLRLVARERRAARGADRASCLDARLVNELGAEMFDYCRRSRALFLLGDYRRSLLDSVHGVRILRLIRDQSAEHALVLRYDRHRPSLLVDRARAEMLYHLQAGKMREALNALNRGIRDIERHLAHYDPADRAGENAERQILVDLRRSLREKYNVPLDDRELLHSLRVEQEIAIRKENYEMAARLRDKINLLQHRMGGEQ